MLLSYPLVWIQTLIKNPKMKKLFSILCGVSILQFCFGAGFASIRTVYCRRWIHSLISSICVLCLIRFCNPKRQPYTFSFSPYCISPYRTLFFNSIIDRSLYTMLTDYMSYALDSTTYQMMLISRFQMLAWSYYDGTVDRVMMSF